MKKGKYLLITCAVLVTALLLTGCKKAQKFKLEQSTNYPITWTEETDGSVTVKLDGSFKSDYTWTAVSSDDSLLEIKAGKEKNGVITYRIKPIAEGNANVEFKRFRDVEEIPVPPEPEPLTEEEIKKDLSPEDQKPEEETSEEEFEPEYIPSGTTLTSTDEEGNTVEVPLFSEDAVVYEEEEVKAVDLEEIYQPEDVVCKFTLSFFNEKKGKKKVVTKTAAGDFYEGEGLIVGVHGERILRKARNEFVLLLPPCKGIWLRKEESKFSGNYYQELNDDGTVNEMKIMPRPAVDEDGNAIIMEVSNMGDYRGYTVFTVVGRGEGTATVTFSSPGEKIRTTINLVIDRDGFIQLDSYQMEDYTPTAAEIEEGVGDMEDDNK